MGPPLYSARRNGAATPSLTPDPESSESDSDISNASMPSLMDPCPSPEVPSPSSMQFPSSDALESETRRFLVSPPSRPPHISAGAHQVERYQDGAWVEYAIFPSPEPERPYVRVEFTNTDSPGATGEGEYYSATMDPATFMQAWQTWDIPRAESLSSTTQTDSTRRPAATLHASFQTAVSYALQTPTAAQSRQGSGQTHATTPLAASGATSLAPDHAPPSTSQ
ncbi:hypothetical protein C8Q76DRAFT_788945 [Earliella scabrosa]|nr:hypothetical protein C8Q76DRAFT_788945 [Earliella scabrosa]